MLELLAPAGSMECAEAAMNSGANAVYLGLNAFSARQSATNFDESAFRALIQKARFLGVKVYVAMNTLVKDEELSAFFKNLAFAWNEGADAIILQDALLGKLIHQNYPQIILHLSTQAGVCNEESAVFAKNCGFSRVILARETPLSEIKKISAVIETEAFVQGALCTCFSGQCYFSSFIGGNSGNRGRCKQPCRKLYAYDRNGNTEKNYALSLSDLCVGEDINKYIEAGVTSFKSEGRMRRAEYVAAATRYYRAILDENTEKISLLSDLRRTYNRGNYTKGLAFGQDKRFLSTAVQGHLGEKIGVVKVVNGKYLVESRFSPRTGDAFKILRDGKEIGGAIYQKTVGKSFVIASKTRLKNGDNVFITTDTEVNERILSYKKRGRICIDLRFHEGEKPVAVCGETTVYGENILQSAQNRPLTEEELKACFLKTDGLPVDVEFSTVSLVGNIFMTKSELNAFRRAFYQKLCENLINVDRIAFNRELPLYIPQGKNTKTAVIATDFTGLETDIAVYKPDDYAASLPYAFKMGKFEKFVYYPAFATEKDLSAIEAWLKEKVIDGVYVENYGGITFAQKHDLKIFAGTGLHILNQATLFALLGETVTYYALSKEANETELLPLIGEKAFVLSSGNIKIMDLCYCPFAKTCANCDKKDVYTLTDENGREFPVRRFKAADGACRFEVYNCVDLIGKGLDGAGSLLDLTLVQDKQAAVKSARNETEQKTLYKKCTSGHFKRGVL